MQKSGHRALPLLVSTTGRSGHIHAVAALTQGRQSRWAFSGSRSSCGSFWRTGKIFCPLPSTEPRFLGCLPRSWRETSSVKPAFWNWNRRTDRRWINFATSDVATAHVPFDSVRRTWIRRSTSLPVAKVTPTFPHVHSLRPLLRLLCTKHSCSWRHVCTPRRSGGRRRQVR